MLTIDNEIDQTTGTFKLKAVFDNKDRALWPNQFVNARLLIDTKKDAIMIPAAAIQHGSRVLLCMNDRSRQTVEIVRSTSASPRTSRLDRQRTSPNDKW